MRSVSRIRSQPVAWLKVLNRQGLLINRMSKTYLVLALVAAALLSPAPFFWLALALLALQLYSVYKTPRAELRLMGTAFTLLLLPLILEPGVGAFLSPLLMIPALPLLNHDLRQNAARSMLLGFTAGRRATDVLRAFSTALFLIIIGSVVVTNLVLALTGALLAAYFLGISLYILQGVPKSPLEGSHTWTRVVAGDTVRIEVTIKSKTRLPLRLLLRALHPWVHIEREELGLSQEEAKVELAMTPPLAGPARPQLWVSALDLWGLIQTDQVWEPVELYVIPRARYAEWLAKKYLEQTSSGVSPAPVASAVAKATRGMRRGVEYHDSRPYQPGDRLKDIDWKHTLKLQEFIVKEFTSAWGGTAIIAVNLTAEDSEQADWLVFNFITAALTLAREAVPTALAAYNHEEVVAATPPLNPREILKKALGLAQNTVSLELPRGFLQPPDMQRLRRTMNQLEQVKTEPAQRLRELFCFEYEAIQAIARAHPVTKALSLAAERTTPPATIVAISARNHDAEALAVTLERLKGKGYNTLSLSLPRQ